MTLALLRPLSTDCASGPVATAQVFWNSHDNLWICSGLPPALSQKSWLADDMKFKDLMEMRHVFFWKGTCCWFLCWTSWDVRAVSNVSSRRHGTSHLNRPCVGNHADLSAGSNTWCGRQASFSAKFAANPLFFFKHWTRSFQRPIFSRHRLCRVLLLLAAGGSERWLSPAKTSSLVDMWKSMSDAILCWVHGRVQCVCLYLLICIDLHTTLNPVW